LADLLRLILLLLLLPVALILIGPLLILAALRGRQQIGPITLDTSRSSARRAGAWVTGLFLWLLVWGGLVWLAVAALTPRATVAQLPIAIATTPSENQEASSTLPPLSPTTEHPQADDAPTVSSTSATAVSTTSAQALTKTATPTRTTARATPTEITILATATASATILAAMATPTLKPAATATEPPTLEPTPPNTPTNIPAFTPTLTATVIAPSPPTAPPTPTIPGATYQAVVATVETGNDLLHAAIIEANEANLQKMDSVWQDQALPIARDFATNVYNRYAKPRTVEFEYLSPPTIYGQLPDDRLLVTSSERWTYGGPIKPDYQEDYKFNYTLTQRNGQWVITRYSFIILSPRTPTPTPSPTITPSGSTTGG
jgi:hypothetical protein